MDTRTGHKQVTISLFARRKKWVGLTTLAALVCWARRLLLVEEPPRYRTRPPS